MKVHGWNYSQYSNRKMFKINSKLCKSKSFTLTQVGSVCYVKSTKRAVQVSICERPAKRNDSLSRFRLSEFWR